MGKNLSEYFHISFFVARMKGMEDIVEALEPIPNAGNYLYRIKRRKGSAVIVHLSDAYSYGEADYDARPAQIKKGAFVLIALPHGDYDEDLVPRATKDGIGVGKISDLMRALNYQDITEPRKRSLESRGDANHTYAS